MELKLNGKEVAAIVLEYAQAKFPGQFGTAESEHTYEPVRGMVLTEAKPPINEGKE